MLVKINSKDELRKLIQEHKGTNYIQYQNDKGETVRKRIAISTLDFLMVMWAKSRTTGINYETRISELIQKGLLYFVLSNKQTEKLTPAQEYIQRLKKWEKTVRTKRHPNVWGDVVSDKKRLTPEKEAILLNDPEIKTSFDAWSKAGKLGLNRIDGKYKTTTLNTWKIPEYCKEGIKKALDNKGKYTCSWRYKYDCSVEVNATEDVQRAWFSLEYKGCGNGHYYILLNDNLAVFAEDD